MQVGDRVYVTVLGQRWPATVDETSSATGAVRVILDRPVIVGGQTISVLYRARADVTPAGEVIPGVVASWGELGWLLLIVAGLLLLLGGFVLAVAHLAGVL